MVVKVTMFATGVTKSLLLQCNINFTGLKFKYKTDPFFIVFSNWLL